MHQATLLLRIVSAAAIVMCCGTPGLMAADSGESAAVTATAAPVVPDTKTNTPAKAESPAKTDTSAKSAKPAKPAKSTNPADFAKAVWPTVPTAAPVADGAYTIVVIPDTQWYSDKWPDIFMSQTEWIVKNKVALNIVFVTHEGDVTNDGNKAPQWTNALKAMDLLNGQVPYSTCPGNHDVSGKAPASAAKPKAAEVEPSTSADAPAAMAPKSEPAAPTDAPTATAPRSEPTATAPAGAKGRTKSDAKPKADSGPKYLAYVSHFGPGRYKDQEWAAPWYGGASPDGASSYQKFTAGGRTFLHISLEYDVTDNAVAFAREVMKANPGLPTIVTTHSYLDVGAKRTGPGGKAWTVLISDHPQIFLVLCGHMHGEEHRVDNDKAGKPVHQVLSDYQDDERGGNGFLRIMTFDEKAGRISVKTYSPYLDASKTGPASQFDIEFDFAERLSPASLTAPPLPQAKPAKAAPAASTAPTSSTAPDAPAAVCPAA